ncbi:MAG: pilus assembly protein [Desulfobacterium sp.]|nr:pilus assembly protein [Desulfobacterium sp.]
MKICKTPRLNNRGAAAVEFAILVPIWFLLFFGMLDYAWYLTNVMVMENAVASGARAGVKVKYWLDPGDEQYQDPKSIAKNAVSHAFWLDESFNTSGISVRFKDTDNNYPEEDEAYQYLEVKVIDYEYTPLTGYLSEKMIPRKISAVSLLAFP